MIFYVEKTTIYYVEETTIEEPSIVIKNHGRTATINPLLKNEKITKKSYKLPNPSQFVSESSVTLFTTPSSRN